MKTRFAVGSAVALGVACATGLALVPAPVQAAGAQYVFAYTDRSNQSWVVPEGVTSVSITLVGGGGAGADKSGGCNAGNNFSGGGAGAVTGTLKVTPGDTLTIVVGQGGINDGVSSPSGDRNNYAFGGGGAGAGNDTLTGCWGSGGGRSAVRSSNSLYDNPGGIENEVLTAAGGGGAGYGANGGAGGGATGTPGLGSFPGLGGTQSAGGAAGGGSEAGTAGVALAGGFAQLNLSDLSEGGGGGGGYYGGGGAGDNSGGGGGSSYVGTSAYFTGSSSSGSGSSAGITGLPAACGSTPGAGSSGGVGTSGSNGCVVIGYAGPATRTIPFHFRTSDGGTCFDEAVADGSVYSLPGSTVACVPEGSSLVGWRIPGQSWAFAPGAKVHVSGEQTFTAVAWKPTLRITYDANVRYASADSTELVPCLDAAGANVNTALDAPWVTETSARDGVLAKSPVCTPLGLTFAGWTDSPTTDGPSQAAAGAGSFPGGAAIPESWNVGPNAVNAAHLYALWK